MRPLFAWFDGRSLREKRLLLVAAALAVLALLWGGVVRPVGDALSSERERYADAVLRLGSTEARVDAVADIARRRAVASGPIADTVRAAAEQAGFTLASLDPAGPDAVKIGIQSARPAALAAWLAQLEASGVLVGSASLTNNGDRTLGVTVTLRARGS
ncbi:type II secretion system protein GspM [uncultured Sphingomonas sp.]|uniref:type II secretion system protein GspM n=1 Tax=uncultured Sphingomonas sp. TaxID=158754 RepID=UPI0035CA6424